MDLIVLFGTIYEFYCIILVLFMVLLIKKFQFQLNKLFSNKQTKKLKKNKRI